MFGSSVTDIAQLVGAVSGMVGAFVSLAILIRQNLTHTKIENVEQQVAADMNATAHVGVAVAAVKAQVDTGNGKTLAQVIELNEGRRIGTDIPAADRSEAEQRYVDAVVADDAGTPRAPIDPHKGESAP